jgi:hypothetical protein
MNVVDFIKINNLKISLTDISILKNAVKGDFEGISKILPIIERFPFLKDDINKRVENNKLFQPGRIVETIIIQSISNFLNCKYKGGGLYENEKFIIYQDGGSSKVDMVIFDKSEKKEYIFEIKEPIAYGKSCGFTYDDNGNPIEFTSKNDKYKEYVKSLFQSGSILENYNILNFIGHNKIVETKDVITNKYDFIVSYDDNGNLIIMTNEEYPDNFNFKIEIRSCGRNTRKVFTKNKLNFQGDFVIIDTNNLSEIIQRGGKTSSRLKYISKNATFSFKKKHIFEIDGSLYINIANVQQHVGEVSIQHFIKKQAY